MATLGNKAATQHRSQSARVNSGSQTSRGRPKPAWNDSTRGGAKINTKELKEKGKKIFTGYKIVRGTYDSVAGKIEDIKTATLWKKQKSSFEPDFCAVKLKDNPWIVQPFEIYEEIRIEEIKKKHQK